MIHTVLGPIPPSELGLALMHEHIIWDNEGTRKGRRALYDVEQAAQTMLPHLLALREAGGRALVEASTSGTGRDVRVLRRVAELTGLHIVTNAGMWDGGDARGRLVPAEVQARDVAGIAALWEAEWREGIEGTGIRPGFLKLALGDEGAISPLQEKCLRAAARVSARTGLTVECHVTLPAVALEALGIAEEEGMARGHFIWLHADAAQDLAAVERVARMGAWVEIDTWAHGHDLTWPVEAVGRLVAEGLLERVLVAQDAGAFSVGRATNDASAIRPYTRIFTDFIPACRACGLGEDALQQIFVANPARALDVELRPS